MTLLAISFLAGALTVLSPCVLPLLPVVLGMSLGRNRAAPFIVILSLSLSIIIFTLLLKQSSAFIMVSPNVWMYFSGGILILFGATLLLPGIWERLPGVARLSSRSTMLASAGYKKHSVGGDVVIGAALGPVFSSCSPTFFVILASVLPTSFVSGFSYLVAYTIGLALLLLCIALLGQRFTDRLVILSNPRGIFKRTLGILFILLGVVIIAGYEKKIEVRLLEWGYVNATSFENTLLRMWGEQQLPSETAVVITAKKPYIEIVNPAGFVNTEGITLKELVGKKVILVDFMTYSCISCIRSFPYTNEWYEKYKDEGLEIVGIHTPEFAFEKNIENVRSAMEHYDIKYPIVLDNEYATWRAYDNKYWPRKYLIDIHGMIVYDHIGEGAYAETEEKIQELLRERAAFFDE